MDIVTITVVDPRATRKIQTWAQETEENPTVEKVLDYLDVVIGGREVLVNGTPQPLGHVLSDGDKVTLSPKKPDGAGIET